MKRKLLWIILLCCAAFLLTACAVLSRGTGGVRQELPQAELPPAANVDLYETVSYAHGCANMQLKIPQGWEYEIREYDPDGVSFGIDFWPEEATQGKLSLNYSNTFDVCGTGLEEKTVTLGPYTGRMGTYDGAKVWDFIRLQGLPGAYVFQNDGADSWYEDHAGEITAILESAVLAQDMIWEEEALAIGAEALETERNGLRTRFDSTTGMWTVEIPNDDRNTQVQIDTKGNVFYRYELCVDPTAP